MPIKMLFDIRVGIFTLKGSTLYAILPKIPGERVVLRDVVPSANTRITLLGSNKELKWKKEKEGLAVSLPCSVVAGLGAQSAYTLRVTSVKH